MTDEDFQLFEAVSALVIVLDPEGRVVYWNEPCSDLTGYGRAEVLGRPVWEFLVPEGEGEPVLGCADHCTVSV